MLTAQKQTKMMTMAKQCYTFHGVLSMASTQRCLCFLLTDTTNDISPRVINVILPDQRHHFLLPLGYVLTTFLLLAFVILIIILITRRHRSQGERWGDLAAPWGAVDGWHCTDLVSAVR